jgi:hypothetical protein
MQLEPDELPERVFGYLFNSECYAHFMLKDNAALVTA